MKFKSIPVRSWHRSRNPPPPAAPLPNEANEEYGSESDELNVSCDPHCENGDTDAEVVPDSFEDRNVPPKKRSCFGTTDTGNGPEWLNLDACIICGIKDELVWPCSGIECPVSFHEKCMNDEPGNKYALNSYCPYCWFKIQVSRSRALREKAVAAEKALFEYLDKEMNGAGKKVEAVPKAQEKKTGLSDGENGNQEHSEGCTNIVSDQHLHLENDIYPSREGETRMGKDRGKSRDNYVQSNVDIEQSVDRNGQLREDTNQSRGQHLQLEEGINQPGNRDVELEKYQQKGLYMAERDVCDVNKATEGKEQVEMNEEKASDRVQASESEERSETEKFQDAEDGKDEETAKAQPNSDARREKIADGSPFVSVQESFSRNESDQAESNTRWNMRRRRRMKLNEYDSDISSNESTNDRNGQDVTEKSNGSFKASSSGQANSPMGKAKNQKRKSTAQQKGGASFVKNDKRKRLFWRPEEEAMLRVGVETLSGEVNKNIPWRKILEMGAKVFHETRTPTDLKEKWRTMNSKKIHHSSSTRQQNQKKTT
ncbi:PREDICTED: uncharacterized protein LOC104822447 isoform X2 [Tarenaya hassleriana]|uniref:uncharacterized protein LOC104822447 isoform X2 n=1 Tax=Tarenaya hassleriana TaxID=28532 RepID=UPI00053C5082|nr:PREDICTED: uncharacterized protein LOC104822447 isoform X2 [Tarenaya hassleriana]